MSEELSILSLVLQAGPVVQLVMATLSWLLFFLGSQFSANPVLSRSAEACTTI